MKDAGEARRTASILHQTPGWRWRRELCLTERSQQCQSGPTTKAWRTLAGEATPDACETPSEHLRGAVPKLERNPCRRGNVGRMRGILRARAQSTARAARKRVAGAGGTARARSSREWTALFQRTWQIRGLQRQETCVQHRLEARRWLLQSECGWHRQTASSGRVQVAPPGSNTWTSADSTIEAGPSYRSCTASPQRRRGVTVPSLIETICELQMTRTNREA